MLAATKSSSTVLVGEPVWERRHEQLSLLEDYAIASDLTGGVVSLFLTKLLSLFIHPLSLGLLLLLGGGVAAWWWRHLGLAVVGAGLMVVWVPSTPVFSDWLQETLESRFPPASVEAAPTADAIVVLGGAVSAPRPPRVYPDLNDSSDRVWHAARLYRADKAPLVIASGGTVPWKDQRFREAPVMQRLLESWGVPPDSVLLESSSANTHGNAQFTARLASDRDIDRVLLVTSALHMRRALATFRSAGVNAIPAATDYRVVEGTKTLLDLLPNAAALAGSTGAIREYVGYWVYNWRGWIAGTQMRRRCRPAAREQDRSRHFCRSPIVFGRLSRSA